jgi:hypothetical protein
MICCTKQQRELSSDGQALRCINAKADAFLQVVDQPTCTACPARVACNVSNPRRVQNPAPNLPGYEYCEYRTLDSDQIKCGVTGLPVTPEICGRCNEETRDRTAKLGDKFFGYASAIKRWVAAGRPTRTKEEVKAIFEEHCKGCEKYDEKNHACRNCGCSVEADGNNPLTNKLAMKTEKCPLGRWE